MFYAQSTITVTSGRNLEEDEDDVDVDEEKKTKNKTKKRPMNRREWVPSGRPEEAEEYLKTQNM